MKKKEVERGEVETQFTTLFIFVVSFVMLYALKTNITLPDQHIYISHQMKFSFYTNKYLHDRKVKRKEVVTEKETQSKMNKEMVQMLTEVQRRLQRQTGSCLTVSQTNRQEELNHTAGGVQPPPEPPHGEEKDVSSSIL